MGEQKHNLEDISSSTRRQWDQRGNVFELTEIDQMVFTLIDRRKILKQEVRTTETAGTGGRNPYGGVSFPEFPSAAAYPLSGDGTQPIGSSSYHHTCLLQLMEDLAQGRGLGGGWDASQQNLSGYNLGGFGDSSQGAQMSGVQDFGMMWPGESSSSTALMRNSGGMGDGRFSDYQSPHLQPSFSHLRPLPPSLSPSSAPLWDLGGMGAGSFSCNQPPPQPSFSGLRPLPSWSETLWNSGGMGDERVSFYHPPPPHFPSFSNNHPSPLQNRMTSSYLLHQYEYFFIREKLSPLLLS